MDRLGGARPEGEVWKGRGKNATLGAVVRWRLMRWSSRPSNRIHLLHPQKRSLFDVEVTIRCDDENCES